MLPLLLSNSVLSFDGVSTTVCGSGGGVTIDGVNRTARRRFCPASGRGTENTAAPLRALTSHPKTSTPFGARNETMPAGMRTMRDIGEVQAVFSPALAEAVQAHGGDTPLRLRVADDARPWIFKRLTHAIPSYRGVPIGDRVQLLEGDVPADAVVTADGHITPL